MSLIANLTISELADIMKLMKLHGVTSLSLGDLALECNSPQPEPSAVSPLELEDDDSYDNLSPEELDRQLQDLTSQLR